MESFGHSSRNHVFLKKLTDTVLENLENEQFGVQELSEEAGVSRSQLHRKLKLLKGKSVSQFIREVRLEEARKLLRNDVATASEIAYRVGFSSPSYFNKCFQKFYGFPPGEVKKITDESTYQKKDPGVTRSLDTEKLNRALDYTNPGTIKRSSIKTAFVLILLTSLSLAAFYFFKNGKTSTTAEKSIAILPFTNLSDNLKNQYLADGIVEDLLNRLSRIKDFKVISRTSSEMYREKGTKSISQIAQELDVSYIVEGSIQRDADKIRVNVQLIDATTDDHIWSRLFDKDLNDIFETQSEIAIQVASEINTVLTTQQTAVLSKSRTSNVKAFELYQLGRFYWNKRTGDGYNSSLGYFDQAIAEDPGYGLAYAGKSDTYNLMALQGYMDKKEGRDQAVELASKALELDETLAEAYNVLASIYTYVDFNWKEAEESYLRAIELNPNYSTAHHYYSEHLSITGRHEKARQHIDKALELDPLSFVIRYVSVKLYYNRGLFKEALVDNQRSHELNPGHFWSAQYDFEINYQLGNSQKAFEGLRNYYIISGYEHPEKMDSIFQTSGNRGLLKRMIEVSEYDYDKAEYFGLLGDDKKAMDYLENSFNNGTASPEFTFKYAFKNLYSNPRYFALTEKMGLPQFRKTLSDLAQSPP